MRQPAIGPDDRDRDTPTAGSPPPASEAGSVPPAASGAGSSLPATSGAGAEPPTLELRIPKVPLRPGTGTPAPQGNPPQPAGAVPQPAAPHARESAARERDRPPPYAEWDPWEQRAAPGWRTVLGVLLVLGGVIGAVLLVLAMVTAPTPPPQPAPEQAPPTAIAAPTTPNGQPPAPRPTAVAALPASRPVRIDVPRAHVHAPVVATGLDAGGTVAVPPIDRPYLTGWYDRSVTPGQAGASVLLGHVDSHRTGPAVFYYLGALRKGDTIEVTRADHRVAVFTVDGVAGYPKTRFPATAVYGSTDAPTLRLVTCGGTFDGGTHSYERNVVVFASLTATHRQTAESAGPPR